ncbi:MAG: hypothetical protein IPJ76_14430 [Flavobacteriales bacterium]|nr:MAG: hypothetical protein IPJ76_14430 [Flavobacteriales bacterium]
MKHLLLPLTLAVLSTNDAIAQCDTLDFEGYPSDTPFENQYQACGVVFSSNGVPSPPVTYDYTSFSWGSVLHSYDWFGELRMDFIDPVNGTTHVPVSYVSFDNPIDTEIDYIVGTAYDVNGTVLTTFNSQSPDRIEISLPGPTIAYIVMDDANGSAYVIDDLVIGGQGNLGLAPFNHAEPSALWPTDCEGTITLRTMFNGQGTVLSADGRAIMALAISAGQQQIDLTLLAPGAYALVLGNGTEVLRFVRR